MRCAFVCVCFMHCKALKSSCPVGEEATFGYRVMLKRNHGYHHNPEAGKSYENHYYPPVITCSNGKSTSEIEVFLASFGENHRTQYAIFSSHICHDTQPSHSHLLPEEDLFETGNDWGSQQITWKSHSDPIRMISELYSMIFHCIPWSFVRHNTMFGVFSFQLFGDFPLSFLDHNGLSEVHPGRQSPRWSTVIPQFFWRP